MQLGVRRPGHFAGIVAQVGQDAAVLAEETTEYPLVLLGIVAAVQRPEIPVLDGIFHQLAPQLDIGLAKEVLLFQPEIEPERFHHRGGEGAHSQLPKVLHHGFPVLRRQDAEDVVLVHHLPQAQPPFQIVVEHMGHAENGIEPGIGEREGRILADGRLPLEIPLQAGVQEGAVHLARVEMDLHFHIREEIDLALLVEDLGGVVVGLEGRQDGRVRPFHPNVDVAALTMLGNRIQAGEAGAFEQATVHTPGSQNAFKLFYARLVLTMDSRHLVRQPTPFFQDVQRGQLLLREPLQPLVANAHERLGFRHPEHQIPISPGRSLLERRLPAQGDQ